MGTEGGEMHQGAPASGGIPRLRTAAAESAGMRTADVSLLFGGRHCHRMRLFHLHSTVKIQPFSLSLSLSGVPLGGIHSQGIWLVIPLELQGKKHQPFSMAQPPGKGKTVMGWKTTALQSAGRGLSYLVFKDVHDERSHLLPKDLFREALRLPFQPVARPRLFRGGFIGVECLG